MLDRRDILVASAAAAATSFLAPGPRHGPDHDNSEDETRFPGSPRVQNLL